MNAHGPEIAREFKTRDRVNPTIHSNRTLPTMDTRIPVRSSVKLTRSTKFRCSMSTHY